MSMALSFDAALSRGMPRRALAEKIVRRTAILLFLGLFFDVVSNKQTACSSCGR